MAKAKTLKVSCCRCKEQLFLRAEDRGYPVSAPSGRSTSAAPGVTAAAAAASRRVRETGGSGSATSSCQCPSRCWQESAKSAPMQPRRRTRVCSVTCCCARCVSPACPLLPLAPLCPHRVSVLTTSAGSGIRVLLQECFRQHRKSKRTAGHETRYSASFSSTRPAVTSALAWLQARLSLP